mmetsp:Transcript_91440/g.158515  ORF Transcript_91440/g.158515 Transcript_91440/m.158515 type:complete len:364 (+) Transcript_91440:1284-2375(+)
MCAAWMPGRAEGKACGMNLAPSTSIPAGRSPSVKSTSNCLPSPTSFRVVTGMRPSPTFLPFAFRTASNLASSGTARNTKVSFHSLWGCTRREVFFATSPICSSRPSAIPAVTVAGRDSTHTTWSEHTARPLGTVFFSGGQESSTATLDALCMPRTIAPQLSPSLVNSASRCLPSLPTCTIALNGTLLAPKTLEPSKTIMSQSSSSSTPPNFADAPTATLILWSFDAVANSTSTLAYAFPLGFSTATTRMSTVSYCFFSTTATSRLDGDVGVASANEGASSEETSFTPITRLPTSSSSSFWSGKEKSVPSPETTSIPRRVTPPTLPFFSVSTVISKSSSWCKVMGKISFHTGIEVSSAVNVRLL